MANVSGENSSERVRRPFIGIHFRCCNLYCRVYKNRQGTAYEGRCPRCGKRVYVPVGKDGVASRFFEAS